MKLNRNNQLLGGLLVLQLLLLVVLNVDAGGTAASSSEEPLLKFARGDVEKISIEGEGGKDKIVLEKKDGKWVLPSKYNFPVSDSALTGFMDKLMAIKQTWPVASTEIGAKQLRTNGDNFKGRVIFSSSKSDLDTLLVGTSPEFRKSHIRVASNPSTFSADLSVHEASPYPEFWYEKKLFDIDTDKILSLRIGDVELKREGDKLILASLVEGTQENTQKKDSILKAVKSMKFTEVLGVDEQAAYAKAPIAKEIVWMSPENQQVVYTLRGPLEDTKYSLKSSKSPFYVEVESPEIASLLSANAKDLVKEASKGTEPVASIPEEISQPSTSNTVVTGALPDETEGMMSMPVPDMGGEGEDFGFSDDEAEAPE